MKRCRDIKLIGLHLSDEQRELLQPIYDNDELNDTEMLKEAIESGLLPNRLYDMDQDMPTLFVHTPNKTGCICPFRGYGFQLSGDEKGNHDMGSSYGRRRLDIALKTFSQSTEIQIKLCAIHLDYTLRIAGIRQEFIELLQATPEEVTNKWWRQTLQEFMYEIDSTTPLDGLLVTLTSLTEITDETPEENNIWMKYVVKIKGIVVATLILQEDSIMIADADGSTSLKLKLNPILPYIESYDIALLNEYLYLCLDVDNVNWLHTIEQMEHKIYDIQNSMSMCPSTGRLHLADKTYLNFVPNKGFNYKRSDSLLIATSYIGTFNSVKDDMSKVKTASKATIPYMHFITASRGDTPPNELVYKWLNMLSLKHLDIVQNFKTIQSIYANTYELSGDIIKIDNIADYIAIFKTGGIQIINGDLSHNIPLVFVDNDDIHLSVIESYLKVVWSLLATHN